MSVSGQHDIVLSMDNAGLMSALQQAQNRIDAFSKEGAGAIKGLTSSFGGLGSALEGLKAPLALLGSVLGGGKLFKDAVSETVEYGKELGKLSRTMGISTDEAATLSVAIGDIYGDVDAFMSGAAKMTKTLATNEQQLKGLGIATRDQNGRWRDTPTLISEVNAKLGDFTAGTSRNIEAQKVYGKSYQEMLKFIDLTPDVVLAAKIKVQELGLTFDAQEKGVLKSYKAAMNDAEDALKGITLHVGLAVMPELTKLGNWFAKVGPDAIKLVVNSLNLLINIVKNTGVQLAVTAFAATKLWAAMSASAMLGPLIARLGLLVAGLGGCTISMDAFTTAWHINKAAVLAHATAILAHPMFWIVAAIIGVATAMSLMSQAEERATKARDEANLKLRESRKELMKYAEDTKYVDKVLNDTKATEAEKARANEMRVILIKQLKDQYPDYIGLIDKEVEAKTSLYAVEVKLAGLAHEKNIQTARDKVAAAENAVIANERMRASLELVIKQQEARLWQNENSDLANSAMQGTVDALRNKAEDLKKAAAAAAETLKQLLAAPAVKPEPPATPDKETKESALAAVKAGLAKERYEYEKAAYDKGQLMEYTKEQEAGYLERALVSFRGSLKERKQLEQMLFETKRDIMKKEQDEKQKAIYEEMKLDKFNYDARRALATKASNEASNSSDRAKALAALRAINDEEADADQRHNDEILSGQRQHEAAMRTLKLESVNIERDLGHITELEALKRIASIKKETFEAEKAILEEKKKNAGLDKVQAQKHTNDLLALEDKYAVEVKKDRSQLTRELLRLNPFASLNTMAKKFMDDSRDKLKDWGGMALKVMNAAESGIDNALQGMIKGTMTFGEGIKSIFTSIGDAVLSTITGMIANWIVAQAAALIFTATVKTTENVKASAALDTAVAETFSAYASIPFIGMGLALGQIAMMMGAFTGMKVANKVATAYAQGGLVDKPTMGLVGEAGTEYIVPETDFKSLMPSLMAQGAAIYQAMLGTSKQVNAYSNQSKTYAPSNTQIQNTKSQTTGTTINVSGVIGDKRELAKTLKALLNRDNYVYGNSL